MKLTFIAILFIVVGAGCTDKTRVPKGILPKEEMREVMWDLMQADIYAQSYIARDTLKNLKKERTILFQQIFDLHKVSRSAFNKSFDYYMGRPDLTQAIFDTLATRQTRRRQDEQRLKDSARVRQLRRTKLIKDSTRKDSIRPVRAGYTPRRREDSVRKDSSRIEKAKLRK